MTGIELDRNEAASICGELNRRRKRLFMNLLEIPIKFYQKNFAQMQMQRQPDFMLPLPLP
jgi:hypothetical protein